MTDSEQSYEDMVIEKTDSLRKDIIELAKIHKEEHEDVRTALQCVTTSVVSSTVASAPFEDEEAIEVMIKSLEMVADMRGYEYVSKVETGDL